MRIQYRSLPLGLQPKLRMENRGKRDHGGNVVITWPMSAGKVAKKPAKRATKKSAEKTARKTR